MPSKKPRGFAGAKNYLSSFFLNASAIVAAIELKSIIKYPLKSFSSAVFGTGKTCLVLVDVAMGMSFGSGMGFGVSIRITGFSLGLFILTLRSVFLLPGPLFPPEFPPPLFMFEGVAVDGVAFGLITTLSSPLGIITGFGVTGLIGEGVIVTGVLGDVGILGTVGVLGTTGMFGVTGVLGVAGVLGTTGVLGVAGTIVTGTAILLYL